ncbi:methylamine dehydrogenase light chain [Acetobacter sp. DsW_063]|uniref:methylamine dehydrogenase light chain n=1 Tax=Acetobacter sp. DsW_063 TaxID=1514894 RepID=UPI000A392470|nr:methylamine dehydrogenase light chain [Acetobacter sp. DsW_063]OUJ16564.1 methylamine dehydrogenase [Acetobacter sp. DsW_063]
MRSDRRPAAADAPLMDRLAEKALRALAGRASRRGVIARIGAGIVAAPALPLLPAARAHGPSAQPTAAKKTTNEGARTPFAAQAQVSDDTKCDYWRYCAIDGNLCSTCGGGVHTCPPGTAPSPTSWIGTCFNPHDRRSYIVAYRDCCGQDACNQVSCLNTDGDQPSYRPQANNDIIWCFGTTSLVYNCSTAAIVGSAS